MNDKDKLLPKHNPKAIIIKEFTEYHNGTNADALKDLFDRTIDKHTSYGTLISSNPKSWFEFDITIPCIISLGASTSYSDSGGSTQGKVILQKLINAKWTDYDEIQPKHNDIVTYVKRVTEGHYRLHYKEYNGNRYSSITEMCCTVNFNILIESNNEMYVNDKSYFINDKLVPIKKENITNEFHKFIDLESLFKHDYDNKNCLDVILESSKSDKFNVILKLYK